MDSWVSGFVDSRDGVALYRAGQFFVLDRKTGNTKPAGVANATDAVLSPAGDRLAFVRRAADGSRVIWTARVEASSGLPLVPARRISNGSGTLPSFSPDGNTIAFVRGGTNLVSAPADSGAEHRIYEGSVAISRPYWSPDGDWIYFVQPASPPNGPGPALFCRVRSSRGPLEVLHSKAAGDFLGVSPDGRTAAWYVNHFAVVHRETRNIGPGYDGVIGFRADEATVGLYVTQDTDSGRIPVTKLVRLRDGASQTVVTGMERADVLQLAWVPDGERLVVRGAIDVGSEHRSLRVVPTHAGTFRDIGARLSATDFRNDMNVSPDGRTVLISAENRWAGKLVEIAVH